MTLILNEIKIENGLKNSYWICAADRRLTFEGKFHSNRKKIFPIRYLNATVSYFGLAVWKIGVKEVYMSDLLRDFILKNTHCYSLDNFAIRLQFFLNGKVPKNLLKEYASGFHLSGFNNQGWPHFMHFSNVIDMDEFKYIKLINKYKEPWADFLERDAKKHLNWDGQSSDKIDNKGFINRNGEIRTHALISQKFNLMMKEIFEISDFYNIDNQNKHADYVRFKFDFIAKLYEKWTDNKVIGKPIDLYILKSDGIFVQKNNKWQQLTRSHKKLRK